MTAILLVEDHETVRRLITRYLQKMGGMEVVATAASAEAAVETLARRSQDGGRDGLPDLVLVDVSLPGMSGIELVALLQKAYPSLPCLMLSGHKEETYVRTALAAGARGYVAKGNPTAIVEAVRRVLAGEIFLSDDLER